MPRINGQVLVYAVVGLVLLLVGLNSIRAGKSESGGSPPGAALAASGPADPGQAGFSIGGESSKLVVDVTGAVRRPGVYRFARGARVVDAISRAGGTTSKALLDAINRAAILSDGQQVIVPSSSGPGATVAGAAPGPAADAPVSLGTATQAQLEEIDGIGPVTAQKIIEFRDSKGGLGSVDELDQISGIGPVTMQSLRAALTP